MTTPAVRIRVLERLAVPQTSALFQGFFDSRIRVEHALPIEKFDRLEKVATWTNWRINLEPVFDAGKEVVAPVSGSCMHRARSSIKRHVVREHADRVAGVQRMTKADVLQFGPFHPCHRL